jgi:hypothetical protein
VNQTKNLAKCVWVDSDHVSYMWEEALLNPGLATAIMQWQLQHHIMLCTLAVNTMVHTSQHVHANMQVYFIWQKNKLEQELHHLRHTNKQLCTQLASKADEAPTATTSSPPTSKRKADKMDNANLSPDHKRVAKVHFTTFTLS